MISTGVQNARAVNDFEGEFLQHHCPPGSLTRQFL
jgi:hypothetical protein